MTHERLSNEDTPTAPSGHRDNKWRWLAENWLAFFSLVVAGAGLIVSFWAMHFSRASDTRAQRMDAAEASAEATIIAGNTNEVFKMSEMWQSIFTQAELKLSSGDKKLEAFRDSISRAQLPPLSPTRDELDVLARADDDTAGRLALCVKWRTIAQAHIESTR
jgi:hypothetical protein